MTEILSKPFVDSHLHVFDAGVAQPQARYVPPYDAPLSAWREASAPLGVECGVLVQPSFLGADNARLLRELRRDPQGLRGVAVVSPDAGLAQLQVLHAAGVRGVRLNLSGLPGGSVPWATAHRLWDALFSLGMHMELHADIGALPELVRVLPAALPLVADHMGKPETAAAADATVKTLTRRARHSPVHVKLSGAYRLGGRDPGALARLWMNELGVECLLWGSDWPHTNHEHEMRYPQLLLDLYEWIGGEAAHTVLADNPNRLYWAGHSLDVPVTGLEL